MKNLFLVDSHVHIHDCYNLKEFFLSVYSNFSIFSKQIDNSLKWIGVLCLTEMDRVNYFDKLKNFSHSSIELGDEFVVESTNEDNSLIITNSAGQKIIIISGKQIIAENGIEVLALGAINSFSKHKSLQETVDAVNKVNAIPIIPWGVGKWLGKRKEVIECFIRKNHNNKFLLGDNSGRPIFWSEPNIFNLGKSNNHFVIPGTDSLAITSEQGKTGKYGFYLKTEMNLLRPADFFIEYFSNMNTEPKNFGKLEDPFRFLKNQIIMQLKSRRKK